VIRLLALDPGKVTGWSLWAYDPAKKGHALRLNYGLVPDGVQGFITWWNTDRPIPVSRVVCEKFSLDQRTKSPDLTPTYIEGALLALCSVPITWQPTSAKRKVQDAVLKRTPVNGNQVSLWLTGSDKKIRHSDARDVNDSQIHALAYLKGVHRPTAEWLFPIPKD